MDLTVSSLFQLKDVFQRRANGSEAQGILSFTTPLCPPPQIDLIISCRFFLFQHADEDTSKAWNMMVNFFFEIHRYTIHLYSITHILPQTSWSTVRFILPPMKHVR